MAHTGTSGDRAVTWLLGGAALALGAAPQAARACSSECVPGYFLPASGGTVPANAPALVWRFGEGRGYARGRTARVHVERLQGHGRRDVSFHAVDRVGESWLVLDEPLMEGATYRLSEDGECAAPDVEFEVGAPAPLPQAFGELTITALGPHAVETLAFGSCSAPVAAVAAMTDVDLSDEAQPWSALLLFRVMVDGKSYPPARSAVPLPMSAQATLYAECPALYPRGRERDEDAPYFMLLPEAAHDVWLEAHVPGVEEALFSETHQLLLECPAEGVIEGTGVLKGSNPDPSDTPDETGSGSACSLQRGPQHPGHALLFAVLGLGAALARRGLVRRGGRLSR